MLKLLLILILWLAVSGAVQARRVALVIGNAAYADAPLRNPVNDASDLASKLRQLGFEVTTLSDRNRSQMTTAIREFGRNAAGAEVALFYFAGHGVQIRGKNYVLPVGQRFADEAEVETDAVDVNAVLARIEEAGAKVSLLILDACRTNPLQRSGRNAGRGLARMEAPSGALIAFAAQPGAEAMDGTGRNGTFTKHLLNHIGTPGLPVEQLFKRVRAGVEGETQRAQSPREESSLTADFYFINPFAPTLAHDLQHIEDEAWALCRVTGNSVPCEDYLKGWAQGRYVALARTRLRELHAQVASPVVAGRALGQVFRDCADCPEMVVIPAGSFMMGSPGGEAGRDVDEGPQRTVTIGRAFALGRTELTVGQWRRFVASTNYATEAERNVGNQGCWAQQAAGENWDWQVGRNWRDPGFAQADEHPVVCVSWNDVREYVKWLSQHAGQSYRLSSEAEWEYAARAGSSASRPWGDDPAQACRHANVADQMRSPDDRGWNHRHECKDSHWFTAPVGRYERNGFGLHDMIGNAWEWVQDCYDEDAYAGKAPSDGTAYEVAGCSARSARGASWSDGPAGARAAFRNGVPGDYRDVDTGFRLARMLP